MGGRGPIQTLGFYFSHGMTLAPLHANYFWIGLLLSLHPVQPHRQFASHCYFGYTVVLSGLQSQVRAAKIFVSSGGAAGALHQEISQKRVSLFADPAQP